MQPKSRKSKELFYTQKRGLYRKAEQIKKHCQADVFLCVYDRNTDKIFSYTTSQDF